LLPGPGRRLWAALATEPATEVTLPAGRPAVSPLVLAAPAGPEVCAEPGFCAEAGFWSADARPARSTAKTSAAAKPPHAYRQTLKASLKARERVADPSTANTLPPVSAIMNIFPTAGLHLTCPVVRVRGVFLHKAASRPRKDTHIWDDMMCESWRAGLGPGSRSRPALVHIATERITHPGPDDEGLYIDPHAALGFRRLATIDLSPAPA
jgi:hypothetical protein